MFYCRQTFLLTLTGILFWSTGQIFETFWVVQNHQIQSSVSSIKWRLWNGSKWALWTSTLRAKDGWPKWPRLELKSESAQEQSTAFVNWHSKRSQDQRKKKGKTHKNRGGGSGWGWKWQNSVFLYSEHKEQFLCCPVCFIQSVTLSLRARSEHFVRDVGALEWNIYNRGQMGWVSRELQDSPRSAAGLRLKKSQAIKEHPDAVCCGRTLSDLI